MASAHTQALSNRHANLDAAIEAESARPNPDAMRIKSLKAEKRRLKDEISREAR